MKEERVNKNWCDGGCSGLRLPREDGARRLVRLGAGGLGFAKRRAVGWTWNSWFDTNAAHAQRISKPMLSQ